jgi:hypothetical protein
MTLAESICWCSAPIKIAFVRRASGRHSRRSGTRLAVAGGDRSLVTFQWSRALAINDDANRLGLVILRSAAVMQQRRH